MTGNPHESLDKLVEKAKDDICVVNTSTYKFLQAMPWPGQPNKFIVLGKQLGTKIFENGGDKIIGHWRGQETSDDKD